MKTFAILSGDTVNNIVIANSKEDLLIFGLDNVIEYTEKDNPVYIGCKYDGFKFSEPITE